MILEPDVRGIAPAGHVDLNAREEPVKAARAYDVDGIVKRVRVGHEIDKQRIFVVVVPHARRRGV